MKLRRKLAVYKSLSGGSGSRADAVCIRSGTTNGDKVGDLAVKTADLEKEIKQIKASVLYIRECVKLIPDKEVRQTIRMRYIQCLPWIEIERELKQSRQALRYKLSKYVEIDIKRD